MVYIGVTKCVILLSGPLRNGEEWIPRGKAHEAGA